MQVQALQEVLNIEIRQSLLEKGINTVNVLGLRSYDVVEAATLRVDAPPQLLYCMPSRRSMLGTRPSQPTRGQVHHHSDHLTEGQSKRHAQDSRTSMGFKVMIISPSKSLR